MSETGNHRTTNQDSAFVAESAAGVADGVGGGPAGDIASASLLHRFAAGGFRIDDADDLRRRLDGANWDIGALARHDGTLLGMATTFTGIVLTQDRLLLGHVGDSRGYLLRDGVLALRTRDDSYVQQLVDAGLVGEDEAYSHPRRNLVTASFSGDERDAEAVTVQAEVSLAGDRWLLCSDGVSDYVMDDAIDALLSAGSPAEAARALVDAALEAGSRDNVTAVVCDLVPAVTSVDNSRPSVTFAGAAEGLYRDELP